MSEFFKGVPVCGLYKNNRKRDGAEYFTGRMNANCTLLILPVDNPAPNHPPFQAFVVPTAPKPADK